MSPGSRGPVAAQFTVDHANRSLPLVGRIVRDVVDVHQRWAEKVAELDLVAAESRDPSGVLASELIERQVLALAREMDVLVRELDGLGIQLKDPATGLIDFPSEIGGRPVLLCWRLGEAEVQFWHDIDAGFAGRQPLTPTPVG